MTNYTKDAHALPYPEGVDKVAVHSDIQALASKAAIAITQEGSRAVEVAKEYSETTRWNQPTPLLSTANINTLKSGAYEPVSPGAAGTMGLPTANYGTLTVNEWASGATQSWVPITSSGNQLWQRVKVGSSWGAWGRVDASVTTLLSTANVDELEDGIYMPISNSAATAMGLPSANIGPLTQRGNGTSKQQTFAPISTNPRIYVRSKVGTAWSAWGELGAGSGGAASLEHDIRVTQFRSRYGGTYGTGGKAVVTLAFDHGTNNFMSKVLPVLERLALPASLGLNSGMYDPAYIFADSDNQTTFAQIQSAALRTGIGILNHGRMHNAGGEPEIVGGRNDLQAALPLVAIEGWMQSGAYGDFDSGGSFEAYWTHPIGQIILNAHAYAMGNIQEPIKALSGDMMPGFDGQWLDNGASPINTVKGLIAEAQKVGGGVMTRMHPMYLDTPGYITTAQLTEFLEWVAAERDTGRLIVLTAAGLNLADSSSSERRNLLPGTFRNAAGWAGTGWALANDGIFTTSGNSPLARTVNIKTHNAARGSTNEFHAVVKATSETVVRLTLTGTGISDARNIRIRGGEWLDVRNYFTIPLSGADTLTAEIMRVSGGTLSVQQANIYPA